MAKIVNIQTEIKIDATGSDETSFELLIEFVKTAPAQGMDQFWRRMEIIRKLRDAKVGDEAEFTADQMKELKEFLNGRKWPVSEEWAVLVESFKPLL